MLFGRVRPEEMVAAGGLRVLTAVARTLAVAGRALRCVAVLLGEGVGGWEGVQTGVDVRGDRDLGLPSTLAFIETVPPRPAAVRGRFRRLSRLGADELCLKCGLPASRSSCCAWLD